MAGGLVVLGGLAAVPLVAASAWSSHSKASEIERELPKLDEANIKLETERERLRAIVRELETKEAMVRDRHETLRVAVRLFHRTMFPLGPLSRLFRFIARLFRHGTKASDDQVGALTELNGAIDAFIKGIRS